MRWKLACLILAVPLISAACLSYPGLAYEKNEVGNRLFREGRFEESLNAYLEAQIERPDLPVLNFNTGAALYKNGDYQWAFRETQRSSSSQDPSVKSKTYYNTGNTYFRMGKLAEAAEEYKKALRLDPDDADAKHNLEYIQLLREAVGQGRGEAQASGTPEKPQEGEGPQERGQEGVEQEGAATAPRAGESSGDQFQLRKTLAEAGDELTIEEALRILDALLELEKDLQATLPEAGRGPTPKLDKDW